MQIFLIILVSLCSKVGSTTVNITSNSFLRDPDGITSSNNYFKLGFFSPPNSTNRYVGIWYNTKSDALEVVWVANKDNPLKGSTGMLKLSEDVNLQVLDGENKVYWSSNTSASGSNSTVAWLQDTGNLVLLSNNGGEIVWQSFEHPTDSLLPQMTIGIYDGTDKTQQVLNSWKSPYDPSHGNFTLGITPSRRLFELFIWDDQRPYWRSGPWNGNFFIGLPATYNWGLTNAFRSADESSNEPSLMCSPQQSGVPEQIVLTSDGLLLEKHQNGNNHRIETVWSSLGSECDVYAKCGPFGKCNPENSPICSCLQGFVPTNNEEWSKGNWTGGCSRRKPLQCGDNMTGNTDGFGRVENIKVPDNALSLDSDGEDDCSRQCQAQCSCLAYAYSLGIGCMTWNRTLIDIQEFNTTAIDLFIRLANSELAGKSNTRKTIVAAVVITGTTIVVAVAFFLWRRMGQQSKGIHRKGIPLLQRLPELNISEEDFKDLPLFEFEKLAAATNNFHMSNKVGEGGFGPVFKGKLADGQEVAVKRLSRASGQGLQELINEVLLISKLQHRNLVRLLGCCIEGEENLLVYEYMPNNSLDALLFDVLHQELLDWKTRLNIIKGLCRGLLYLHRDSRLRIIHRDLKASNILLDEDLIPKISDFGTAKIFGSKEDQGKTSRVVGTYGYMSPEYAMEGRFSEKSDVYSFGVLLLEIISGRKNGSFKDDEDSVSLLAHVWKRWNEDNVLSLIDPTISNPCYEEEISKCIHIGLLCVQEFPDNRPSISTVISMVDSEFSELPRPMQPGFTQRGNCLPPVDSPNNQPDCSMNNVSITFSRGR